MRFYQIFITILVFTLFLGCEKKDSVKPEEKPKVEEKKVEAKEDLSFNNVMKILKEALDNEKNSNDSATRLNTAKAYIMVIKFLKTDKEKVRKYLTDKEISDLRTDARENAKIRLDEIIKSPTAPKPIKEEAQAKLSELNSL